MPVRSPSSASAGSIVVEEDETFSASIVSTSAAGGWTLTGVGAVAAGKRAVTRRAPTGAIVVAKVDGPAGAAEYLMEDYQIKFDGIGPKVIVNQNPVTILIEDDDTAIIQMLPPAAVNGTSTLPAAPA